MGVSLSCKKLNTSDCNVFSLQVVEHLEGVFSKRNSPNKLKVSMPLCAKPWLADVNGPLYKAARRAIKTGMFLLFSVFNVSANVQGLCSSIEQKGFPDSVLQSLISH